MIVILCWAVGVAFGSATCLAKAPGETARAEARFNEGDLFADTWVATDALGRVVPDFTVCGPVKNDKWVGIFYWTWHTGRRNHSGTGPHDNSKILARAKQGKIEWPKEGRTHYWGEPELGYYRSTDPFVIRKHASMLADAGIDVILFDTTNPPHTFREQYEALCREYTAMRAEGAKTPSIAFIAPFGDPRSVVARLWKDLYEPAKWRDLWFLWDGKPLLLADKQFFDAEPIGGFFTFRRPMPDYWKGPSGPDQWSWLEVFPQHVFKNRQGEVEQMSVGVAQNAIPDTPGPAPMSHKIGAMGRSWHGGKRDTRDRAVRWGFNFDEQWQRAIDVDPKFVFVTGWNEWIAGRNTEWSKYTDKDCYYPGGLFVDQYTHEYSRDCEPMRGGHGDNYYYQLASWVRRFKGVREPRRAPGQSAIAIDGDFEDWRAVTPEFRDTIGDTTHRDHPGCGKLVYRDTTGRNDFVVSKAAFDDSQIYFFVSTSRPITATDGKNWMLLWIDVDQRAETGWLGYDFLVNLEVIDNKTTTVHAWRDGEWQPAGKASYRVNGNRLEVSLPRKMIGETAERPSFDFHWADNIARLDDPSEFGLHGDSAPNRRWNYRYETEP